MSARRILVVEDEPSILELVNAMLKELGYTVLSVGTPGEAIRLIHADLATLVAHHRAQLVQRIQPCEITSLHGDLGSAPTLGSMTSGLNRRAATSAVCGSAPRNATA